MPGPGPVLPAQGIERNERSCYYFRVSKGDLTRTAILDEASRVASRVGLGGLTIGTRAAQTNLAKSGLFGHFQSKEPLQLQVLEPGISRFGDQLDRPELTAHLSGPW